MAERFKVSRDRDVLIIRVMVEKFDFLEVSASSSYLRNMVDESGHPGIVIDLSGVAIIDSSVLGFLLEVHGTVKRNGNEMALVCSDKDVLHVISMMNMPRIIRVFPETNDAVEYVSSPHRSGEPGE